MRSSSPASFITFTWNQCRIVLVVVGELDLRLPGGQFAKTFDPTAKFIPPIKFAGCGERDFSDFTRVKIHRSLV